MKRKIGQFQAQSEDGRLFTIYEYHDIGDIGAASGHAELPASRLRPPELRTAEGWPVEILEAADGQQALELVGREPLDLIIMNLGMPLLDGWEATRRIRALPTAARAVPILALTAYALPEYEHRARAAGCTAYLTKPVVDVPLLQQTVRQLLGRGSTP